MNCEPSGGKRENCELFGRQTDNNTNDGDYIIYIKLGRITVSII
jgi:hypothetical protein